MALMKFEDNRFIYLFFCLMIYFIIPPFFVNTPNRMHIISALFSLILVISVYAIERNRRTLRVGIVLAAILIGIQWFGVLFYTNINLIIIDRAATCLFFALVSVGVINYIIRSEEVTASIIFGAICGYLLIGISWSFLHALIYSLNNQAYAFPATISNVPQIATLNFIYFSFVSISTVGFGDITPVSHVARTFTWLEAITGQIYLTVWIARLLALHITHSSRKHSR